MAGTKVLSCVFGCEGGVDKLEHYAVCGKVWPFLQRARPGGLGLDGAHRSLDGFLLVSSAMSEDDKLAMAIGVNAVGRAVALCSRRKDQVCVSRAFYDFTHEKGSVAQRPGEYCQHTPCKAVMYRSRLHASGLSGVCFAGLCIGVSK